MSSLDAVTWLKDTVAGRTSSHLVSLGYQVLQSGDKQPQAIQIIAISQA